MGFIPCLASTSSLDDWVSGGNGGVREIGTRKLMRKGCGGWDGESEREVGGERENRERERVGEWDGENEREVGGGEREGGLRMGRRK